MPGNHRAFISHFDKNPNAIKTPVGISSYPPLEDGNSFEEYPALWDTGATNSCISPKVADELQLPKRGLTKVGGINDSVETRPLYMVAVRLPSGQIINPLVVGTQPAGADVLLGMDIISMGDFAISHDKAGDTHLSFVIPPLGKKIDFNEKMAQNKKSQRAKACRKNRKR